MCASADTWPSLLGLVNVGVPEQYLWSLFILVSAAVQNTWGPYNPVTWGEALVWTIGMVLVAVLFSVIVGFIVAAIKSSIQTKAKYKERMDMVVVSHELPCLRSIGKNVSWSGVQLELAACLLLPMITM